MSGDYYDVFPLGNGKLGLCIADVAGKGLPAVLLMSNLQAAEAAKPEQEEFGEERLSALLHESPLEDTEALQSRIMRAVTQFCSSRVLDDATVVVLVVEPPAATSAASA